MKTTEFGVPSAHPGLQSFAINGVWKLHALALGTTFGAAYILCAIFDVLFPPFGMIRALAPASAWPLFGSPLGFLLGFVSFTIAGLFLGALHGIAWEFWSKRLAR